MNFKLKTYINNYLEMQVLAEGRCPSSAGRIVTEGIGWNPSSEAGREGEPNVRKIKSCSRHQFVAYMYV